MEAVGSLEVSEDVEFNHRPEANPRGEDGEEEEGVTEGFGDEVDISR